MLTHPFVGDLSNKTTEELMESINSLNNKLTYIYKLNKMDMVRQISMVLQVYRNEYNKRQEELYNNKYNNDNKININ